MDAFHFIAGMHLATFSETARDFSILVQSMPNKWTIAGLVVVGAGLILGVTVVRRHHGTRSNSVSTGGSETPAASGTDGGSVRELESLLTELDELAQRIHGKLDSRFARLESVIREADERIEQLSRLVRSAQGGPAVDVTIADGPPQPPHDDRHAAIYELADRGQTAAQIARALNRNDGEIELILSLRKVLRHATAAEEAARR